MAFNPPKFIDSLIRSCTPDPKKAGKTLLVINAMGMVFAALSNTYAAAVDKNTSAEDKKFLVPAGFVTGAANIGLYYAMTEKIINKLQGTKKYKDNGFADKVLEYMKKPESKNKDGKNLYEEAVLKFANKEIEKAEKGKKGLFSFGYKPNATEIEPSAKALLMQDGIPTKEAKQLFENTFKSGFGVMGAFIGAVVGCAILTPIIRDVSAWAIQKMREKKNPELKEQPYKPYFEPTRIESVRYGNKKQPLSMKNYMAFTHSGSLKV